MWNAKTFTDRLRDADFGGKGRMPDMARAKDESLPEELRLARRTRHKGRVDYKCPCCGLVVQGFRLADVSGFPIEITGGAKFACDGCRTKWDRHQVEFTDIDGKRRKMTMDVQAEKLGAPAEHLQKLRKVEDEKLLAPEKTDP